MVILTDNNLASEGDTMQELLLHNREFVDLQEIIEETNRVITELFPKREIERVLFIKPPDVDLNLFNYDTAKRGRYPNYPSYCFGIMATHLRKYGVSVKILNLNSVVLKACKSSSSQEQFDFNDTWKVALKEEISSFRPDIIGVTCMFTQTHRALSLVCSEIKKVNQQIPLAVGGVHITNSLQNNASADMLINDLQADFFFLYECDIAFSRFVQVVNMKEPITSLAQVLINHNNKRIRYPRKELPSIEDLNVIPAHDLMNPIELSKWGKVGSYTALIPEKTIFSTVQSNRGCRGKCTFCSVRNFNGPGIRRRKVQSVIDEILLLRNEYGVEHIMWLDDDFLYDHKESMFLFNEMVNQKVNITWDCTNGVVPISLNKEIVSAAVESGCIGLNIGMESGNKEILKMVKKPATITHFLRAAEVLHQYPQIFTKVFLIIGFPGETYRQLMDTITVAKEMCMDWYLIQILQPLPNTPIFKNMVDDGLINPEEFDTVHVASGAYGKVAKKTEKGRDLLSIDFKNAFNVRDLDATVPKEKIDGIWAYMNFHLNYYPLFRENAKQKIKQKILHLEHIFNVIAPNDAMAMYFAAYLKKKLYAIEDIDILNKLTKTIDKSAYWTERFKEFNLTFNQIWTEKRR